MEKEKFFTLKTKNGCFHMFSLLIAAILIFSFCAQLLTTSAGRTKVENIRIDSRGAILEGDLYYPAGVSDKDKLPAVILIHGAGVNKGNYKSIAEELARRDFVVFNINAYGTSGSEMPPYDETGQGQDGYGMFGAAGGAYDALEFVRTLNFVDQTRLSLAGHSMGSFKAQFAGAIDSTYLTLNDLMINVLHDTFGQSFTEKEILENADELAKTRLNDSEMAYYEYLKAQQTEWYNTRVLSYLIIGTSGNFMAPRKIVNVAGHEVSRNCQANVGIIVGTYDNTSFVTSAYGLDALYVEGKIATDSWYAVNDITESSKIVGTINDSVANNTELLAAANNRQLRFVTYNPETHSKNFFSTMTTSDSVAYLEQTLQYNRGDLTNSATKPLAATNTVFVWREIFNFLAMLAMIGMLAPLAGFIYKTEFFASCVGTVEMNTKRYSNKRYLLIMLSSAVISFIIMYFVNKQIFVPTLPTSNAFPLWPAFWLLPIFLLIFAGFSLLQLVVFFIIDKKNGISAWTSLNIKMSFLKILKTLLAAVIIVLIAYASLAVVKYLFNQDYRMWMFAFDDLKVEYWRYVLMLLIFCFIPLLIIGSALNYHRRTDIPEWLEELLTVICGSFGVWLIAIINILVLNAGGKAFSNWQFTYQFLLAVPVTIYLLRRLYKATGSVWLGAFVSSLILGWSLVGPAGHMIYRAQDVISTFFHF